MGAKGNYPYKVYKKFVGVAQCGLSHILMI
jgi:hypothetical protein